MKKIFLLLIAAYCMTTCVQTGNSTILIETTPIRKMSDTDNPGTAIQDNDSDSPETTRGQFKPEEILISLQESYPEKVRQITFKENDWALQIYDKWFYWAEGRLLPEEALGQKELYSSHFFYTYPKELPQFTELSAERKQEIEQILDTREATPISRHRGFHNTLWRIHDRESAWAKVKTTYFLGYKVSIHRDILEDLAAVEEELQNLLPGNSELSSFVASLKRIDGFNWRQIADTDTLSVHSYGIALDLIMNDSVEGEIYWLWSRRSGLNFYDIPYNRRFSPPEEFIEAFEKYGFVWGGKWLFYDTIHFEYRPEILRLNR